ncbi:hypothetical protein CHS0354_022259, partial [Potamilus streckersoni]
MTGLSITTAILSAPIDIVEEKYLPWRGLLIKAQMALSQLQNEWHTASYSTNGTQPVTERMALSQLQHKWHSASYKTN